MIFKSLCMTLVQTEFNKRYNINFKDLIDTTPKFKNINWNSNIEKIENWFFLKELICNGKS